MRARARPYRPLLFHADQKRARMVGTEQSHNNKRHKWQKVGLASRHEKFPLLPLRN